ncbi:hypothetical protein JCM3765_005464 [Sporobolomyces pararoseus]
MSAQSPEEGESEKPTSQPSILTRSFHTVQLLWRFKHFLPTVAFTSFNYYLPLNLFPRYHDSWSFSTALFVSLTQFSSKTSKIQRIKEGELDIVEQVQKQRKRLENLIVNPKDLPPKNGTILEVEFKVKKRGLKGILKSLDDQEEEKGDRILKAEWSAHDSLFTTTTTNDNNNKQGKVLLYFHGGAYCYMSPKTHRPLCLKLSKTLNCPVFSVDYRLSPETKFPGNLHDAVSSYLYLTQDLGIPSHKILIGGDSAGGNLSTALLLYLKDHPTSSSRSILPRGGILFSPWLDLTSSFKSWDSNKFTDYISLDSTTSSSNSKDQEDPLNPSRLFVEFEKDLIHPYVSPSISSSSNLRGLPPLLVFAGGSETLRDEISIFCEKVYRSSQINDDIRYEIFEGGIHVFMAIMENSLGKKSLERIREWDKELDEKVEGKSRRREEGVELEEEIEGPLIMREVLKKLKEKWEKKPPRPSTTTGRKAEEEDRFIFEEFLEPAPKVELREFAHPLAVKAVQELSESFSNTKNQGFTRIIRARKNPNFKPKNFWARLHL